LTESDEWATFSDVPSEYIATSIEVEDRRTRKRSARRDVLLALAADLVEAHGPEGLTMAALAEAADYAPASLYTYFASRSALLAALQQEALGVLGRVTDEHLVAWDDALSASEAGEVEAALARLLAFSRLFLTAPQHHAREFRLQQRLLVTRGVAETADVVSVVPAAMAVLDVPRRLLAAAVDVGALAEHRPVADPLDHPLDGSLLRMFSWIVALNGALTADEITAGLPTTGVLLGEEITDSLLRGWGADPEHLAAARALAQSLPTPAAPA